MLTSRKLMIPLLFSVLSNGTSIVSPNQACSNVEGNPPSPAWVNDGGFLILIVAVIAMFWGLALVCEDYFVPALNVFCEEWKVSTLTFFFVFVDHILFRVCLIRFPRM